MGKRFWSSAASIGGFALAPFTGGWSIPIGGAISAGLSASASAGDAQDIAQLGVDASMAGLALQRDMYNQTRADLMPLLAREYSSAGFTNEAQNTLAGLMGFQGGGEFTPTAAGTIGGGPGGGAGGPAVGSVQPNPAEIPGGVDDPNIPQHLGFGWTPGYQGDFDGPYSPGSIPMSNNKQMHQPIMVQMPDGQMIGAQPWELKSYLAQGGLIIPPEGAATIGELADADFQTVRTAGPGQQVSEGDFQQRTGPSDRGFAYA